MVSSRLKSTAAAFVVLALTVAGVVESPRVSATDESRKPPAKEPTDEEKLQGTWKVVAGESGGTKIAAADFGNMKVTFKGKVSRWEQQGSEAVEGTYLLAPTKTPKLIDFGPRAPVGKKPAGPGVVAIYKFERDQLFLCVGGPNKASRPKEFTSPRGVMSTLYILERVEAPK